MSQLQSQKPNSTLDSHVKKVISGERKFENVYQAVSGMILGGDDKIEKVTVNGRPTYDFKVFRKPGKHIVGMFDEVNSFVSFVKDAAEGGSSREMAFILIGEPGNGKTYFVDYLNKLYRDFVSLPENMRYTFKYKYLDKIEGYGKITAIESQTYEDPMILAMNIFDNDDECKAYLSKLGASDS
ncbi:MAG: serine protein kinase, partial [Bacteroidota bacterium]|nr:serine protein kinase [Bacteroidota bacterium]